MSTVVHVRRTIVVEYDVDRADFGEFTDDQVVAAESEDWRIVDYDDSNVTSSRAEVTFR